MPFPVVSCRRRSLSLKARAKAEVLQLKSHVHLHANCAIHFHTLKFCINLPSVFGTLTLNEGTMKKFSKNATAIQMCCEWALFKRVKFQQTTWPLHRSCAQERWKMATNDI